jgi:hypothetical protein
MAARQNKVTIIAEASTAPYKALSFRTMLHSYPLIGTVVEAVKK